MTGTVPGLTIVCMGISCVVGYAIPIVLFFYFRKKKNADIVPFFVGCAVMLIFALILESAVHQVVLASAAGEKILNNTWLYALYGGLMAGLFEETGRFIAFKTVLRKYREKDINALMYGAGHGGFEAAVILGVSMVYNIVIACMINSGNVSAITDSLSGEGLRQMQAVIDTMTNTSSLFFLIGILERLFAVMIQLSLSVMVWFAAKNKWYLYLAAILIHLIVDAVSVILSQNQVPVLVIEAVVGIMAALTAVIAKMVWDVNVGKES